MGLGAGLRKTGSHGSVSAKHSNTYRSPMQLRPLAAGTDLFVEVWSGIAIPLASNVAAVTDTTEADTIFEKMEKDIQDRVLRDLRDEFDDLGENAWWYKGVPKNVRKKVMDRIEESGGGLREHSFDFLHYEAIIRFQWSIFRSVFARGKTKNVGKERGTGWIREIADWRNKVMHPSRRDYLSLEELSMLEQYQQWLEEKLGEEDEVGG